MASDTLSSLLEAVKRPSVNFAFPGWTGGGGAKVALGILKSNLTSNFQIFISGGGGGGAKVALVPVSGKLALGIMKLNLTWNFQIFIFRGGGEQSNTWNSEVELKRF